ncbi:hypothetical protein F4X86_02070 [Candidatus Saccharibacteria bacterium]|nr:hypothetical protein [Candidatus Saccharibacteria bacterium]
MDNQSADNQSSKKKISIRKHLPLPVRVYYDIVRNWSPIKLAGLAAMSLVAVFGVLLTTQVLSPQSQASVNGSSSNPCAPSSVPSTPNGPGGYTLCSPTTLTLNQAGGIAEVTLVSEHYSPAVIGYVVSNDPNCDSSTGDVITRIFNGIRVEGYKGGIEFSGGSGGWPYYQANGVKSWSAAWQADNSMEFEFEYPITSWADSDADYSVALHGKYLCMSISYWDNNAQFKTYKGFDLMYAEMTSKTRTDSGTTYQFSSNRNAHWAQGSASGTKCNLEVDTTSGQASTSFTLEADGPGHRFYRCVKAQDSNGVEASVIFFVSEEDADPSKRSTEEDNSGTEEEEENTEEDDNGGESGTNTEENNGGGTGNTEEDDDEENTPTTVSVDDFITTYGYASDQKDLILEKDDELMDRNIWEYDETETTHYASTEDAAAYHILLQAHLAAQQAANTGQNNDQSGTVVNSVNANNGAGNTVVQSTSVNAGGTQTGSVGDTTTVPDTGILDDQNAAQLVGYILVAAAILGSVRVLMVKKYKKVGR